MKNEEKSNDIKNFNSVRNKSENNINKNKNKKLYHFVFLVDEEIGNSWMIKAIHELNEENQENKILLNKNNSIKMELSEIKALKDLDKIIKSIDGIIFINKFHDQKKLNKILELMLKIEKKIQKNDSKKFFPKLLIGNRTQLMIYFENNPILFNNDIYISEFPIGKPLNTHNSSEYLIKIIQIPRLLF